MNKRIKLNGWWRLWIVSSLIWLSVIGGIAYANWTPSGDYALHHPAFYDQLEPKQRSMLEAEGARDTGNKVQMPNGHTLNFRSGVQISDQEVIARAYHALTVKAQAEARQSHIQKYAFFAFIPCMVLALMGIGIAWVMNGFKNKRNELNP